MAEKIPWKLEFSWKLDSSIAVSPKMCSPKMLSAPPAPKSAKISLFPHIPRHNQCDILKKLNFKDFANFTRCSKETLEISSIFNHRLPHEVQLIEFDADSIRLNRRSRNFDCSDKHVYLVTKTIFVYSKESNGKSLEEFCRNGHLKATEMRIFCFRGWTLETLINVLKLLNVKKLNISTELHSTDFLLSELILHPEYKKISEIEFARLKMKKSDFLLLDAPRITILESALTASDVNEFIKAWFEGEKTINKLDIRTIRETHSRLFIDLDVTVVDFSKVSKRNMTSTPLPLSHSPLMHLHSLVRSDAKRLLIAQLRPGRGRPHSGVRIIAGECDNDNIESWLREIDFIFSFALL